jgi:hypothetical protein
MCEGGVMHRVLILLSGAGGQNGSSMIARGLG